MISFQENNVPRMTQHALSKRIPYIDNLKILLAMAVVSFHASSAYTHTQNITSNFLIGMYNSILQAFFMGFFFMISGYLTPGAYDRKGAKIFLKERFLRLGIPLLIYIFFINPALIYTYMIKEAGYPLTFWSFYLNNFLHLQYNIAGTLWFIENLLVWSVGYAIWRRFVKVNDRYNQNKKISNMVLILFVLFLATTSLVLRLLFPNGYWISLLNLEITYSPQYISAFIVGVIAYRRNYFANLSNSVSILWLKIAVVSIFFWPVLAHFGGATESYRLALNKISMLVPLYAAWEAVVYIGICVGLLVLFRENYNKPGTVRKILSANAYAVYIIHAPIVMFLQYILKNADIYPLFKFGIVTFLGILLCFLISHFLMRRLPYAKTIL